MYNYIYIYRYSNVAGSSVADRFSAGSKTATVPSRFNMPEIAICSMAAAKASGAVGLGVCPCMP